MEQNMKIYKKSEKNIHEKRENTKNIEKNQLH